MARYQVQPDKVRELWQAKLEHLDRFGALTAKVASLQCLHELSELLVERQEVIAAVDRLDAELAGAEPPGELLADARRVLAAAAAREAAVRRRLQQVLRLQAQRLLQVATRTVPESPAPPPRFMDRQA